MLRNKAFRLLDTVLDLPGRRVAMGCHIKLGGFRIFTEATNVADSKRRFARAAIRVKCVQALQDATGTGILSRERRTGRLLIVFNYAFLTVQSWQIAPVRVE